MRLSVVLLSLLLSGCVGSLNVWGINVDIPDDDDDAAPPDINYDDYEGVEFMNIDWSQQAENQGAEDCIEDEGWTVSGALSTGDDNNFCPECDYIWRLTYTATPGLAACLEGSGFQPSSGFLRQFGFAFTSASDFDVWRTIGEPHIPMTQVGIGALDDDASFTWGGGNSFRTDEGSYEWFLSGEGSF